MKEFYEIEVTDLFGSCPNYAWVKRFTLPVIACESDARLIKRVKATVGIRAKHEKEQTQNGLVLRFREPRIIIFIDLNNH